MRRFDHRRVEVGGRRPRRAAQDRGATACDADPERPERSRALVEHAPARGSERLARARARAASNAIRERRPRRYIPTRAHSSTSAVANAVFASRSLIASQCRSGADSCSCPASRRRVRRGSTCSTSCRTPSDAIVVDTLDTSESFEACAHEDRRGRSRGDLRRLLDGRTIVPAARARPARSRARSRARERVAGTPYRRASARHGRAQRRGAGRDIERDGVDAFLERWLAQPMFASIPPARSGVDDRRQVRPEYLAACLRVLGDGRDGADVGPTRRAHDAGLARHRHRRREVRCDRDGDARSDRTERRARARRRAVTRCRSSSPRRSRPSWRSSSSSSNATARRSTARPPRARPARAGTSTS